MVFGSTVLGIISTPKVAKAIIYQERYKISDIEQTDIDKFCRDRFGQYTQASLNGDTVICSYRKTIRSTQKTTKGGTDVLKVETENNQRTEWGSDTFHLGEVCDMKHWGMGTYLGGGGKECWDSYRHW